MKRNLPRKQGFVWRELIIVVVAIVAVSIILFPIFLKPNPDGLRRGCSQNLKHLGMAIALYMQDADYTFPSLKTAGGWRNSIAPYVKNESIYFCPSVKHEGEKRGTDYWFNSNLSGYQPTESDGWESVILMGDGYSSDDPHVSINAFPAAWYQDLNSPLRRHYPLAPILWADGHGYPRSVEGTRNFRFKPTPQNTKKSR